MNAFQILPVLLLLAISFSCTDQKSTERKFINTPERGGVQEEKIDSAVTSVTKDALKIAHAKDSITKAEQSEATASGLIAKIPSGLSDKISKEEVPTAAVIGVKAYPEAYIVKLNPTEYKGKKYVTLELVSSDTPEEVLEFYNKWDSNWFFIEGAGVYTFKKDKEKYFRETNTLQILAFNKSLHQDLANLLNFEPRSLIRIYYEQKEAGN